MGLDALRDSFEGIIPSIIATVDAAGMPNVSTLSQVYYVDPRHVALSNQFFSKTVANVQASGVATVMVVDGWSGAQHMLDLRFVRAEKAGALFDRMAAHLAVISALQGMGHVMRLRSADIYAVLALRAVALSSPIAPPPPRPSAADRLGAAAGLVAAIAGAADADTMLDTALDGIGRGFGFAHAMVLVPAEGGGVLHTLASRGYAARGVGAEVTVGEGTIGIAAAARLPIRISDLGRGRRYASAVQAAAGEAPPHEVPWPGLDQPQSQLALPMLSQGALVGVLFLEAATAFAFGPPDEDALMLVASQLATGLRLAELQGREGAAGPARKVPPARVSKRRIRLRYFAFDDSVFLDDAYLVKGVPGRLLHAFVRAYLDSGRTDFTNAEIRRDPGLRLPDLKDNLETRLILLRRRLDEKAAPIRLARPERGRIRLEVDGVPEVEVVGPADRAVNAGPNLRILCGDQP